MMMTMYMYMIMHLGLIVSIHILSSTCISLSILKYYTCTLYTHVHPTLHAAISPLDAVADEDYEDRMLHRKASQVNFDPKVTDRKSNLTRDPTPFPKELHSKAMQWRAAREKGVGGPHHGREGAGSPGVGMDEVALRRPVNRRLPNRYSLLKALSDPLIEVMT